MRPWTERPREEAYLFNPSYCALVAWHVASGYANAGSEKLPFELMFLALPVALHKQTREALPKSTRTSLAVWLNRNADVRVGIAERARAMVPFGREGLLFAAAHGLLEIRSGEFVVPSDKPQALTKYLREATVDTSQTLKKAEFVGKWFAVSGTIATIMALWGVRP